MDLCNSTVKGIRSFDKMSRRTVPQLTIYDYVGWECFKGGQDMNTWWPWYVFRPFIGVPITSFMLVACRTSMFSSLFTSRDLNTYLVLSFLAGFAMMEFVKMLRRSSQALFGE